MVMVAVGVYARLMKHAGELQFLSISPCLLPAPFSSASFSPPPHRRYGAMGGQPPSSQILAAYSAWPPKPVHLELPELP